MWEHGIEVDTTGAKRCHSQDSSQKKLMQSASHDQWRHWLSLRRTSGQMMAQGGHLQMKSLWGNFQPSLEIEYNIDFLMNYTLSVPLILTLNVN
jgi:hypothetical protein